MGINFFQHVVCSIVPYGTKFSLLLLLFTNCTCLCFGYVHKRIVRDCGKTPNIADKPSPPDLSSTTGRIATGIQ
jgi:hypothetical protein